MDIQIMRSDKLGYNAPIVVYDKIYYTYADPDYSITEMPLTMDDCKLIKEAITLLDNKDNLDTARAKMVLAKSKDQTDIHPQFRIVNLRFQSLRIGGFLSCFPQDFVLKKSFCYI